MMKCDDCLNLLSEYMDGEASEHEAASVSAHLIACANCTNEFEALTAEQEIYARYDRELEISPAMWNAIAARTAVEQRPVHKSNGREWLAGLFAVPRFGMAFSGAAAVVLIAVVVGVMYLRMQPQPQTPQQPSTTNLQAGGPQPVVTPGSKTTRAIAPVAPQVPVEDIATAPKTPKHIERSRKTDDPGVLFKDVAYSDLAERDTAEHIRQAENLLRSIRSLQESDDDVEIDVAYEKAMSQRLLNENVVLRRDAETAGKFPTKELLGELEPFLIDIANLPDKTTPDKLRAIKDRARKTEIVAALVSY